MARTTTKVTMIITRSILSKGVPIDRYMISFHRSISLPIYYILHQIKYYLRIIRIIIAKQTRKQKEIDYLSFG